LYAGGAPGASIGTALAMIRDSNGDGFGEVVVASPRDDSLVMQDGGSVEVIEFTGSAAFGTGNGSLQLARVNGPPGFLSAGAIVASGAAPSSPGLIAADLAYARTTISGAPLYLALSPALLAVPITYDATGAWSAPVDLRQPLLAGLVVYTQAFELAGASIVASGGLELLFSN
jgi:hypothetical protein